jgi:hypothetical protein
MPRSSLMFVAVILGVTTSANATIVQSPNNLVVNSNSNQSGLLTYVLHGNQSSGSDFITAVGSAPSVPKGASPQDWLASDWANIIAGFMLGSTQYLFLNGGYYANNGITEVSGTSNSSLTTSTLPAMTGTNGYVQFMTTLVDSYAIPHVVVGTSGGGIWDYSFGAAIVGRRIVRGSGQWNQIATFTAGSIVDIAGYQAVSDSSIHIVVAGSTAIYSVAYNLGNYSGVTTTLKSGLSGVQTVSAADYPATPAARDTVSYTVSGSTSLYWFCYTSGIVDYSPLPIGQAIIDQQLIYYGQAVVPFVTTTSNEVGLYYDGFEDANTNTVSFLY